MKVENQKQEKEARVKWEKKNKEIRERSAEASGAQKFWAQRKNFENAKSTRSDKKHDVIKVQKLKQSSTQTLELKKLWTKLQVIEMQQRKE